MKKLCTLFLSGIILVLFPFLSIGQSVATDFTANDCGGTSHHLFSELDAGKVVVISFVMPCGSCIGPSQSALATVQNFASSHPGKVVFYLADDVANTSCSSLSAWATNNGMGSIPAFSSGSVTETPYGSGGMPKIVVLGGTNHSVYFTQNGGVNSINLTNAINSALTATGISEVKKVDLQVKIFPNPAIDKLSVNYILTQTSEVNFEIYNMLGSKVKTFGEGKHTFGKQESQLDFGALTNGIYFLKIEAGSASQIIKFTIAQ
ncbi:MAG: T9SS type A sorting domain-containing protein [Bacteroidia bacterium]|nr:T9SS type A sorting domain-containing protein [Bacteroidia bacterium]